MNGASPSSAWPPQHGGGTPKLSETPRGREKDGGKGEARERGKGLGRPGFKPAVLRRRHTLCRNPKQNQTSTRSEPRRDSHPAATQRTGPGAGVLQTLLARDADYYGPVSSVRRRGNCCEVSPTKQGVSFTKKPSRDYQSPTGSNSRIELSAINK
ncbi:hypothetical protein Taro_054548 [Colocasia esculenta]|uniref:Uncharacterized protein n=1 Tax=Colocasia esculenta TaxID=4460 RepID=A0A843XNZ6_COLES|nr:hypothetical protein [Colocasia esculenta]